MSVLLARMISSNCFIVAGNQNASTVANEIHITTEDASSEGMYVKLTIVQCFEMMTFFLCHKWRLLS